MTYFNLIVQLLEVIVLKLYYRKVLVHLEQYRHCYARISAAQG